MTSVCVYGLGYVGLPTAAILADTGLDVTGIDIDEAIVRMVNSGQTPHADEDGLDLVVARTVSAGRLRAATTTCAADVHIITVGTPITREQTPDLRAVELVTRALCTVIRPGDLVILESTVPPATCERLIGPLVEQLTGLDHKVDYALAHCPERVMPGNILHELIHNDRLVGGTTTAATQRCAALYARFAKGEILETDATTAEMCKLMENTFRDVNIALANELADIAREVGVDIERAIDLANRHPRVWLHKPGIGVGGHCIPVDPWFLVHGHENRSPMIRLARSVNDARPVYVAKRIVDELRRHPSGPVALLGLSYKANVDDLRGSPAVEVAIHVARDIASPVWIVEPHVTEVPASLKGYPNVTLVEQSRALHEARVLVRLVGHRQFASLSRSEPAGPRVLDAADLIQRPSREVDVSGLV